jgi:hypothetical protein
MQLPNSANAHPSVKDCYYRATIEGLAASLQAPSLRQFNVLSSRFNFPHLIHKIDGSLQQLCDNTIGIVTAHPLIFQLSRPLLCNNQGAQIPIPNLNAANAPNNICHNLP